MARWLQELLAPYSPSWRRRLACCAVPKRNRDTSLALPPHLRQDQADAPARDQNPPGAVLRSVCAAFTAIGRVDVACHINATVVAQSPRFRVARSGSASSHGLRPARAEEPCSANSSVRSTQRNSLSVRRKAAGRAARAPWAQGLSALALELHSCGQHSTTLGHRALAGLPEFPFSRC